ncbi:MAG: hypothetical protein IJ057_10320 [Bacteroidales bacterium]|nr:hypothetical protein [Bacteroidales bacterium]
MKVQIEIPKRVMNIAIAQLSMNAKDENDSKMIDQAVERCNKEVTNLDLDELDEDLTLRAAIAFAAIVQQGNNIENEFKEQ